MALINVPDIQNLDAATPELFNSRFGVIANEINGNIDDANLKAGAVITSKLANDAVTGAKIQLNNNEPLEALNASSNAKTLLRLGTDDYLRLSQLPTQVIAANSTLELGLVQAGWTFVLGSGGTGVVTKAVTFPTAYTSPPVAIMVTFIGAKDTSDPTVIGDFTVNAAEVHWTTNIGTTGFTIAFQDRDSGSSTSATRRYGYSWIAIGAKT